MGRSPVPSAGQVWRAPGLQTWGGRAEAEVLPKQGLMSPFTPSHLFSRAPMSGEGTCGLVVETFCRQKELILLQTDPASPRSCSVKEKKSVEMKNVSTSNREISI